MVGQLSSLVGDEVGTRVYDLLNRVQMWRVCSVFFLFFPCRSLVGKAPQAGAEKIGCNCGANAPYFFQVRFLLLDAHWGGSCTSFILIIPAQSLGKYMSFNLLIGIVEHPSRADNAE